jgi:glycosyltransferase involved in cell wall biosynthesis
VRVAMVNLTSGGLSGGYRKYLDRIVPPLREHPRVERLDVFVPAGAAESATQPAYETWPVQDGMRGFGVLRARLAELKPDVVFVPTARWIDFGGIPSAVMVRNMEPLERPFTGNRPLESLRNVFRAHAARRASMRADRVIAVSGHVRDFICARWGIPQDKVGLVYHGIDPATSPSGYVRPARLPDGRREPNIFTAGSIRPARGLEDLVQALAILRKQGRSLRLDIAGAPDPSSEHYLVRIQKLAATLGVDDAITWLGHLAPQEMSWCFANAVAFVMTSRCEACPNTALEAMAHGALCISTDTPPMPEFFADSALYYRAGNAGELAARLLTCTVPSESLDVLRVEAVRRAAHFTWADTVSNTVAELEATRLTSPVRR